MNTPKARDYLFDNLTQYGRRAMTILDPYWIFKHFYTGHKALKPSWKDDSSKKPQLYVYVKCKGMVTIEDNIFNTNNLNIGPDRDYYRERFNEILRRKNYIPQDRWWINIDENIPPEININPNPNPPLHNLSLLIYFLRIFLIEINLIGKSLILNNLYLLLIEKESLNL